MPISYRIDRQHGVIYTTAQGVLTGKELMEHKRALLADPDYRPGYKELSDVRNISALDVSTEDVGELSLFDAQSSGSQKSNMLAIVTNDDLTFGMARMYQSMVQKEVPKVNIFRDMSSARKWLGLPEEE